MSSTRREGNLAAQAVGVGGLDAHPVVRQHFGRLLKEGAHDASVEANRRLYEHYKALPQKLTGKELPDTLEEMQPLFAAIAHGCAAGLHQEVFDDIYYGRLRRGAEPYLIQKLGGFSANLGALAHFFDPPWGRPHPSLRASDQAVALNFAGFTLRALGRLRDAVEPDRVAVKALANLGDVRAAAGQASNLSQLLVTLGDIEPAVTIAREGVAYADKSGDAFQRMGKRAALADALNQAGDTRGAEAQCIEAERPQKEQQPELPRLYSLQGYWFCDLLLGQGRHAEVAERAAWNLRQIGDRYWLLGTGLDTLSLGRAVHQACLEVSRPARTTGGEVVFPIPSPQDSVGTARRHFDIAVEGLRKAGQEDYIARGLLARGAFRRNSGEWDKAQEDLEEAYEIVSRGGMRLFLTDYHLERARLRLAQIPGVRPPDEWTLALARAAAATEPAKPKGAGGRLKSWFGRSTAVPAVEPAQARPPTLTDADRALVREAREEWAKADALIQATGYHRRDGELEALRALLDELDAVR